MPIRFLFYVTKQGDLRDFVRKQPSIFVKSFSYFSIFLKNFLCYTEQVPDRKAWANLTHFAPFCPFCCSREHRTGVYIEVLFA